MESWDLYPVLTRGVSGGGKEGEKVGGGGREKRKREKEVETYRVVGRILFKTKEEAQKHLQEATQEAPRVGTMGGGVVVVVRASSLDPPQRRRGDLHLAMGG